MGRWGRERTDVLKEKCHVQSFSHHSCTAFLPSAARERGCRKVKLSGGLFTAKGNAHSLAPLHSATLQRHPVAHRDACPCTEARSCAFLPPYPGTPPAACSRKAQPHPGKVAHLPLSSRGKGCAVPKAQRVPRSLFPTQRPQGAPEPFTWGLSLLGRLRHKALLW